MRFYTSGHGGSPRLPLTGFLALGSLFFLGLVMVGCRTASEAESAIRDSNRTNIQRLANLYSMYQFQNRFQGPKDEETFRSFIQELDADFKDTMGIDPSSIDKLFISERDKEPFRIRYNVPTTPRGSKEAVIFESSGRRGQKMVGFLNMVQREVDEAEYNRLWEAKVSVPAKEDSRVPGL